jgi:hypothetical protein
VFSVRVAGSGFLGRGPHVFSELPSGATRSPHALRRVEGGECRFRLTRARGMGLPGAVVRGLGLG